MIRSTFISGCVLLAIAPALHAASAPLPQRCTQLNSLLQGKWPDTTTRLEQSQWRPAGTQVEMRFGPAVTAPDHCDLTAIMRERVGIDGQHYAIRFHMRLPRQWNGRFFFEGGGGTEGDLGSAVGFIAVGIEPALLSGYAVVSHDSGHDNAVNSPAERGGPVAFGFDPLARADYGGAALGPVAAAAKAVIHAYYRRSPQRSYFVGCSKGGQEGMAFAQRYPEVFDGIVAAAPGFSLPRAAVAEAWDTQAFASLLTSVDDKPPDSKLLPSTFSDAQLASARESILAACDGDDGVRDGMTAAFGSCTWPRVAAELRQRTCSAQLKAAGCLSEQQVDVLRRVYSGPVDKAGHKLYSDWPLDAGMGSEPWRTWKIGPANGTFPGINVAMGAPALAAIFTTPPSALGADPQAPWKYVLQFDFDQDARRIDATDGQFPRSAWVDVSARSPQLGKFRRHGGKMLVPHGASDPVFSINDTLAWYHEVDALNGGAAADFVRVFPVPGMAHCAGGPATDQFDAFAALVAWVEKSQAPQQILARAGPNTPWPGRTRPLCAYPRTARYKGSGSIESAENFACE